jgi:predicted nucleic acid-binding protein
LIARLFEGGDGAISTQVLAEFYSIATRKLCMKPQVAAEIVSDLRIWTLHRPTHADIMTAIGLQQHRYAISWWDALIVSSANARGLPHPLVRRPVSRAAIRFFNAAKSLRVNQP